jgi:hypothetical protein
MGVVISFASHSLEFANWATLGELSDHLAGCNSGSFIAGLDADCVSNFDSVTVDLEPGSADRRFGIGLCSGPMGLPVQLLPRPASRLLLLGLNDEVVGFSVATLRPAFLVRCAALVYRVIETNHAGIVLIITEIGAACITEAGVVLWEYAQDLLASWALEGDTLSLAFLDTAAVRLNILEGPARSE